MKCEHCTEEKTCDKLDAMKFLASTSWTPAIDKALSDPGKDCPRFKCKHNTEPECRQTYLEYICYCTICGKKL